MKTLIELKHWKVVEMDQEIPRYINRMFNIQHDCWPEERARTSEKQWRDCFRGVCTKCGEDCPENILMVAKLAAWE